MEERDVSQTIDNGHPRLILKAKKMDPWITAHRFLQRCFQSPLPKKKMAVQGIRRRNASSNRSGAFFGSSFPANRKATSPSWMPNVCRHWRASSW